MADNLPDARSDYDVNLLWPLINGLLALGTLKKIRNFLAFLQQIEIGLNDSFI